MYSFVNFRIFESAFWNETRREPLSHHTPRAPHEDWAKQNDAETNDNWGNTMNGRFWESDRFTSVTSQQNKCIAKQTSSVIGLLHLFLNSCRSSYYTNVIKQTYINCLFTVIYIY